MRLRCFSCGKSVSTEVPDDTIFRATAECPECVETHDYDSLEKLRAKIDHLKTLLRSVRDEYVVTRKLWDLINAVLDNEKQS